MDGDKNLDDSRVEHWPPRIRPLGLYYDAEEGNRRIRALEEAVMHMCAACGLRSRGQCWAGCPLFLVAEVGGLTVHVTYPAPARRHAHVA